MRTRITAALLGLLFAAATFGRKSVGKSGSPDEKSPLVATRPYGSVMMLKMPDAYEVFANFFKGD